MSTPLKTSIILTSQSDWEEWLEILKTNANGAEIWPFVDPSTAKDDLPELKEPDVPMASDVNPDKTRIAELTPDEREELSFLRFIHKRRLAQFDRSKAALGALAVHIQETVSRTYLTYTFGCETAHDMLVSLRRRAAPTDQARRIELLNRYQDEDGAGLLAGGCQS